MASPSKEENFRADSVLSDMSFSVDWELGDLPIEVDEHSHSFEDYDGLVEFDDRSPEKQSKTILSDVEEDNEISDYVRSPSFSSLRRLSLDSFQHKIDIDGDQWRLQCHFSSPTTPCDEFGAAMDIDEADFDRFQIPSSDHDQSGPDNGSVSEGENQSSNYNVINALPFDERFEATAKSFAESIRRSQATRRSLTMQTPQTEKYTRRTSISTVVDSVERSAMQIQTFLSTCTTPSTSVSYSDDEDDWIAEEAKSSTL